MGSNGSMNPQGPAKIGSPSGARLRSFHELMQHRVQRILLVSSLYDSFIMSEEGQLHETLLSQFIDLNLSNIPDLQQVSSAAQALELLARDSDFDMVITSVQAGDCNAAEFASKVRQLKLKMPVLALAYTGVELRDFVSHNDTSDLDRVFLWQGDVRILLAMVKYLEDQLNAPNDCGDRGVPLIIVIEDNVRFYSSFLPTIYTEILAHTRRLLSQDLNLSQKMMRMRARTKLLLCSTYEQAWSRFERYGKQVLGVISDFEFPHDGKLDPLAGLKLCTRLRESNPDLALVMQSSHESNRQLAEGIEASFLLKGSPVLLQQLRQVLMLQFGFGDFVFRLPDQPHWSDAGEQGSTNHSASDLRSLVRKLRSIPAESIAYHSERNHFSNWLKARTEFALAQGFESLRAEDFDSVEDLRKRMLELVDRSRLERHRTIISNFDRDRFEPSAGITRMGAGSLGGKARGVAFANRLLRDAGLDQKYDGMDIGVPPALVLSTDIYDAFLEHPGLREFGMGDHSDPEVLNHFVAAPFPREAVGLLRSYLQKVRYPLAVRSSGLLEDSLSQPFAGVYSTHMLPNNDPDLERRWTQLAAAIKQVYASVFLERARSYVSMTPYRLEEEKMAVLIQAIVGNAYQERFYPDFSGVARSINCYPEPGQSAQDGVVALALGLGRTVEQGNPCLRFSPKSPRRQLRFSSVDDVLKNSQRSFFALDLSRGAAPMPMAASPSGPGGGLIGLVRHPLEVAEADGRLSYLGSTYSAADDRIVEGTSRKGVRLVSFAQVLGHAGFPLAELIGDLLDACSEGMGGEVEIEFAGNLPSINRPRGEFSFLQLRPLAISREREDVEIEQLDSQQLVCRCDKVLGNGKLDNLYDAVVVDAKTFDRLQSQVVAAHVGRFDAVLGKERRPYLLIGVGRWGSSDPSLGIPVGWHQIAGARVIVEAGFQDIRVVPSQGTHFFQNLTSGHVGYFTVNPDQGEGTLDWDWLRKQPALEETPFVRRLRFDRPLHVVMNGRTGEGVILKPQ